MICFAPLCFTSCCFSREGPASGKPGPQGSPTGGRDRPRSWLCLSLAKCARTRVASQRPKPPTACPEHPIHSTAEESREEIEEESPRRRGWGGRKEDRLRSCFFAAPGGLSDGRRPARPEAGGARGRRDALRGTLLGLAGADMRLSPMCGSP